MRGQRKKSVFQLTLGFSFCFLSKRFRRRGYAGDFPDRACFLSRLPTPGGGDDGGGGEQEVDLPTSWPGERRPNENQMKANIPLLSFPRQALPLRPSASAGPGGTPASQTSRTRRPRSSQKKRCRGEDLIGRRRRS